MKIKGYKLFLGFTLMAVVLMGTLAATIVTLASTRSRMVEPEPVSVEAMISLSPTYGGANTLVNITGIGFTANSRVSLFLSPVGAEPDSQPYAEALADADGRFSVMFPMPATRRDGSPVLDETLVVWAVTEQVEERALAEFDFIPPIIQPEVGITPTKGAAGTPVTVTSSGFPAGARVQLYLAPPDARDLNVVVADGMTDASGNLNSTFTMPEHWPDGTRIKDEQLHIQVVAAEHAVTASAGFDYVPVPHPLITISPNNGGPGTVIRISGDGYPAGVRVLIKTGTSVEDAAQKPAYVETMADTRGLINLDFTMPGYWPSGLPILARDVVVLATAADKTGYGWMGFAYLSHAPEPTATDIIIEPTPDDPGDATSDEPGAEGEPSPEPTQSDPEPTSEATHEPAPQPVISVTPETGAAGSEVQVIGSGFPADTAITVYLALPGIDPAGSYGDTVTDASGNFSIAITVPAEWPDGSPIAEAQIEIVAATADFTAWARALFNYQSAPME